MGRPQLFERDFFEEPTLCVDGHCQIFKPICTKQCLSTTGLKNLVWTTKQGKTVCSSTLYMFPYQVFT